MKKVIITGATGMIGVHLINEMIERSIQVVAIIRENSKRIHNIPHSSLIKVVECSLKNIKDLELDSNDFDVWYHLAWDGTFGESRNDEEIQKKNLEYLLDAVRVSKKYGCKKFIGVGSQAEYGRVNGVITSKTYENPENFYGKYKLIAGIESRKLSHEIGMTHTWIRLFSAYGPYDGENTMIMTSIREMSIGESPEYTPGGQNWDYIYAKDVAKALYLAGINTCDKTYCLASGDTRKLKDYIEIIRDKINPSINLKLGAKPYAKNQVMNLNVDISDIKKDLNFNIKYSFENGIEETIDWYRRKYKK